MSSPYALLVVGAGPAGLAAARAFRETRPTGRVALITDEHRLPYNRPPLTKELLRGESAEADLPLEPESFFDDHHIELIAGRAVALDPEAHTVTLSGGRVLDYEHCLLATGAEPIRPDIPGADHPRVSVMRTLEDLRRLERQLAHGARVIVVGSGFIACEIASSLAARDHQVDLVSSEDAPNGARLGAEAAARIAGWLTQAGVRLHLGAEVQSIEHDDERCVVVASGSRLSADLVVLGTGVAPRGELARAGGLALENGAIPVDASMRTARAGLLAAGDVAFAENLTAGRRLRVEHWGDALGQGAVAGQVAAGITVGWGEVPGFWSSIGPHTLKYVAWGDGFDDLEMRTGDDGAFSVRYGRDGILVGVLTHDGDDDLEQASAQIAEALSWTS